MRMRQIPCRLSEKVSQQAFTETRPRPLMYVEHCWIDEKNQNFGYYQLFFPNRGKKEKKIVAPLKGGKCLRLGGAYHPKLLFFMLPLTDSRHG